MLKAPAGTKCSDVKNMTEVVGLESICLPAFKQLWTANKNNLSFPELRGDYRVRRDSSCSKQTIRSWTTESSDEDKHNSIGWDESVFPELSYGNKRMDLQNNYAVALSAEVYGLLSWLQTLTEQLTKLGIHIQHPDQRQRVSRILAFTVVKIAEADLEKRRLFRHQLLTEANDYLSYSNNRPPENTKGRQKTESIDDCEYETLHCSAGVKAGRNSFRAFSRALRGGGEHCNSSDLGGRRCGGVTFASSHLEKIEYLWKLARVQVQVLKIQLNNRLTPLETSRLFADDVIGRAAASSSCSASLNLDLKDIGEDIAPLASSPEKCLRIGMTHMPKDSSIAGSYDSGIDRCTTSSNLDASSSAKDDGYFTRWGGGDEMWLNDDEAVAAEIDAALQGLSFKSRKLELPREGQSTSGLNIRRVHGGRSTGGYSERDWEEIYDTVDRFSQNTLSLLSWLEELKDVQEKTGGNSEIFFYRSKEDRIQQITKHAEKLYDAVKRDAALLTETLSSESDTILSVLEKVESQSAGLGVFFPLRRFPKVTAKQGRVNTRSASAGPAPSKDLQPIASTPKHETKRGPAHRPDMLSSTLRSATPVQRRTRCSDLNPFSGSFNSPFRSGWYDFTDEYNAILEWICGMERLVDAEDAACVTRGELDVAYEQLLAELRSNVSRRSRFRAKADDMLQFFPERRHDVRIRLAEIEMLWEQLETRISIGGFYSPRCGRSTKRYLPLERDLRSSSSPPSSRAGSAVVGFEDACPVPLEDHSLYQIRDKIGFGASNSNMQHLRPSGAKSVGDKATSPSYAKEMSWLSDKSSRGSYASATWSTTVAAGSENENKDSGNDDLKSDLTTNNGQDEPEPLSHDDTADKNVDSVDAANPVESASVPETSDKQLAAAQNVDADSLSSSEPDEQDSDLEVVVPGPNVQVNRLSLNPYVLSSRILEFHFWLRGEEEKVQERTGRSGLGWFISELNDALTRNQNHRSNLREREGDLMRILKSSEIIVSGEQSAADDDDPDEQVDLGALAWSSLMLQHRFVILDLYSFDMELVIERRIDVLNKDSRVEMVVAHPLEGVWSDHGEAATVVVHANESAYRVLCSAA